MSYKGHYNPTNPQKYKGNSSNIIYRSLWERKFMVYCDTNSFILEWGSEEIIIPNNLKEKIEIGMVQLKHGESTNQNGNTQLNGVTIMIWSLRY